jgi:hypothetical protein
MSDDKPSFNATDLKKLYATPSGDELAIDLCFSGRKAFIKPMKVRDKKDILKAIESKDEKLIQKNFDDIIEKYVTLEDKRSTDDLTIQERYQVLVAIRRAAAGDTAKLAHQCPKCEHINKDIPFNMDSIVTTSYEEPKDGGVVNVADGAIKLVLGPIRREDEKKLEKIIFDKKVTLVSERQFIMMAGYIHKVIMSQNDITAEVPMKIEERIDFFENLRASDLDKITDYIKATDFGVKLPFSFKCEKCGHVSEEEANIAVFFIS